jgi:ribosomal protein S18 acetylase RimI-like enzyme
VNDAEVLELACSDAWPPLSQDLLGQWRLRWADGFTGRANSALAIGDPGVDSGTALKTVCEFAHSHGIPAKVQVVQGSPTETMIEAAGWVPDITHAAGHDVVVLVGEAGANSGKNARKSAHLVLSQPTPAWWELTVGSTEPTPAERHVLTGGTVGYGLIEAGETAAGAVRGALVGDLLHVARLAVRPEFRRQGLAVALLDAVEGWAADHGATRVALQVSVTNAPALALYAALGFAEHHRYRYWVPPVAPCEDRTS